jgi:glycine C-acetyltransferase
LDAFAFVDEELRALEQRGIFRWLRCMEGPHGPVMTVDGRRAIVLASSNYLGLSTHPRVTEAAGRATAQYGCSVGASRLIAGNHDLYAELEGRLAGLKRTEAALVFSTGYMANLGVLTALAGPDDVVFSDALNHASIIDGIRLSRAAVAVFPHNDVAALEDLLRAQRARRRIVIVDGVFSMDGDVAPLPDLLAVARRWGALLVVDDAHGTGTLGPGGAGALAACGLAGAADEEVATLGKALGSFGAFVAGPRKLIRLLINKARSFIFTCGLPPAALAASGAALDVLRDEPGLPLRLMENARLVRDRLRDAGFDLGPSTTHILPEHVGDSRRTMDFCERLLEAGVFAQGIRHPTVPEGTERLRITPMATHTREQLETACRAIVAVGGALGLPATRTADGGRRSADSGRPSAVGGQLQEPQRA